MVDLAVLRAYICVFSGTYFIIPQTHKKKACSVVQLLHSVFCSDCGRCGSCGSYLFWPNIQLGCGVWLLFISKYHTTAAGLSSVKWGPLRSVNNIRGLLVLHLSCSCSLERGHHLFEFTVGLLQPLHLCPITKHPGGSVLGSTQWFQMYQSVSQHLITYFHHHFFLFISFHGH